MADEADDVNEEVFVDLLVQQTQTLPEDSGKNPEKAADGESSTESESARLCDEHQATRIEKPLSVWSILALSAVALAIDFGYAVSDAMIVPLLVGAGLSLNYASVVMAVSPILGMVFQLFLGSLSDECTCFWGRRRPFILFLSLVMCAGFFMAPFTPLISDLSFDNSQLLGILLTILAVMALDFGLAQSQSPSRAYLLDSVPPFQLQTGNFVYTMLSGVGMCLGFVVSSIDWASLLEREKTVVNEAQVVFGMVVFVTLVTVFITVCSVKETPKKIPEVGGGCRVWRMIQDTFLFLFLMSRQMWILWLTTLFGFIAIWVFLFFTTFVGEVVYEGVSSAAADTVEYQLYAYGVQIASWGLAIGGGLSAVLSLFIDRLADWIGLKLLFFALQYVFIVACFLLTIVRQVPLVLGLAAAYGPYVVAYLTIPFTLIPVYHESGLLLRKPWPNGDSVIGKACAVMYTAVFGGQVIAGFLCGPLSTLFKTSSATMMIACAAASISYMTTHYVDIPSNTK